MFWVYVINGVSVGFGLVFHFQFLVTRYDLVWFYATHHEEEFKYLHFESGAV